MPRPVGAGRATLAEAPDAGHSLHPGTSLEISTPARPRWTRPLEERAVGLRAPTVAILVAAAYAILWAVGMASYHQAPPLDSAEQLVWSYAMEGGYWKHPPLPSWIMHGLAQVFGPSVTLTFFAVQASAAAALLLLWRLGCEFMSARRSFAAAALTGLIGYYGWSSDTFNHNSALPPFEAAAILCFWLALRRGRPWLWALTGLSAGLAMLVKYAAVLPLAALLLYFALDRRVHTARNAAGLLLAGVVAGVVVAPHVLWLQANHFMPLRYARSVAVPLADIGAWVGNLAVFGRVQVLLLLPFLLVLAWMLHARRSHDQPAAPVQPGDRLFLWTVGVAPLLMVLLLGVVRGHAIIPRWGHNLFLLAGWLALDAIRWPERRLGILLRAAAAAHIVLWIVTVLVLPRAADWLQWQGRANFPGRELASAAETAWTAETGQPLRLVVSDIWLGGTLAAYSGRPLAVLADGEPARAPWVSPGDVRACGALVLQDRTEPFEDPVPGVSRYLEAASVRGEWTFAWAPSRGLSRPRGTESHFAWGIIRPEPGEHCPL